MELDAENAHVHLAALLQEFIPSRKRDFIPQIPSELPSRPWFVTSLKHG
jgi:hypothetical protein